MEQNIMTDYIIIQDEKAQPHLIAAYELIDGMIGDQTEKVFSFQMPTFKARRNVVHFAAFKQHIGIYPGAAAIAAMSDQFGIYEFSKGTLKIKYNQPFPTELVKQLVEYSYSINS